MGEPKTLAATVLQLLCCSMISAFFIIYDQHAKDNKWHYFKGHISKAVRASSHLKQGLSLLCKVIHVQIAFLRRLTGGEEAIQSR